MRRKKSRKKGGNGPETSFQLQMTDAKAQAHSFAGAASEANWSTESDQPGNWSQSLNSVQTLRPVSWLIIIISGPLLGSIS